MKIKAGWIWFVGIVTAVLAFAFAWAMGLGEMLRKQEKQKASKELADELKAKVEKVRAERAEEKKATEAAVVQVQAAAEKEMARDSVDAANDLIAAALSDAGKPSSKG